MVQYSISKSGANIILRIFAAILLLSAPLQIYADDYEKRQEKVSKQMASRAKKDAKKQAKELKKEGYSNLGGMPLESKIYSFLLKMEDYGGSNEMLEITVRNTKDEQYGWTAAFADAAHEISNMIAMSVEGAITGMDVQNDDDYSRDIINAVETQTKSFIQGELKKGYGVSRRNSNGRFDMKCFYYYNPTALARSSQRALKQSLKDKKVINEISEEIDEFIKNR